MDKIRALTVFRRIVELGSFQAAATDLKLSKAAVTKNINELEISLDTPLINRTTRKLVVTESGLDFYREVCVALDTINNAEQTLFFNRGHIAGKLKIGCPVSLGIEVINRLICEFSDVYPNVSIEILMDDRHLDLISQGVDVAIRGTGALADSSLKSRKLNEIKRTLCASQTYLDAFPPILSPLDLKSHQCLGYSLSSSNTWRFDRGGEVEEVDVTFSHFTVNNSLALVEAATLSKGVILTPYTYVKSKLDSGELVEILPDWLPKHHYLYAVYPSSRAHSKLVRSFIDFLIERILV
ncbi:LysR family transcriptional regulator [Vibrio sp. HN007]|uniref:LysR family transcriptional regulator n=1 Tax=Vibrio iocasae TaxID=3098914 RepID=UPI0035D4C94E